MSKSPSKNILPAIKSQNKKQKLTRNPKNRYDNNKNENIDPKAMIQSANNINLKNQLTSNSVKIIDEVTKSSNRIDIVKKKSYKIIFVFRMEDFILTVKLKTLIKEVKKEISQLIGLSIDKLALMYQDIEIDEAYDNQTVEEYFDLKYIKFRPIVYIKKKFLHENGEILHFNLIPRNYDFKVKIQNIPSNESVDKIVNQFFKNYYSIKINNTKNNNNKLENSKNFNNNINNLENMYNYKIENILLDDTEEKVSEIENHSYIICFSSQDLAFDFNRYISAMKILNQNLKEVKSSIISIPKKKIKIIQKPKTIRMIRYGVDYTCDETNLVRRNSKILKLVRNNYLEKEKLRKLKKVNSQSNITGIGPYLSEIDKQRLEMKENRKKWMSPEGFISCVGKYSGIQI